MRRNITGPAWRSSGCGRAAGPCLWQVVSDVRPDVVVARNPTLTSYALFLVRRARRIPFLLYVQRAAGCRLPSRRQDAPRPPIPTARRSPCCELDAARKNHVPLVRHTAGLLRAGRMTLTIAGLRDAAPSPAYAALLDEIASQGVAGSVRVEQNLPYPETRALYAAHDLLVLASSRERASVALAAGLPVICGSDNGTNFVVRPGETGHVFADGDFEAMARLIAGFADRPAEIRRMGMAGRRMIGTDYSPAAAAHRFEAIVARRLPRLRPTLRPGPSVGG